MPLKLDIHLVKRTELWAMLKAQRPEKSEEFLLKAFMEEETRRRLERGSMWIGRERE